MEGRHGCSTCSTSMAIWDATGRYSTENLIWRCAASWIGLDWIGLDWIGLGSCWIGLAANAVLGAVTFSQFLSFFSTGVGRAMDSPVLNHLCSVMARSSLHLVSYAFCFSAATSTRLESLSELQSRKPLEHAVWLIRGAG